MRIKILKEKIVKVKTIFKKELLDLAKEEVEAIPAGDYFILSEPFNKNISKIKKDFVCSCNFN